MNILKKLKNIFKKSETKVEQEAYEDSFFRENVVKNKIMFISKEKTLKDYFIYSYIANKNKIPFEKVLFEEDSYINVYIDLHRQGSITTSDGEPPKYPFVNGKQSLQSIKEPYSGKHLRVFVIKKNNENTIVN